jgi:hypothetical protein
MAFNLALPFWLELKDDEVLEFFCGRGRCGR